MLVIKYSLISDYTDLATSSISQRQILSFHAPFNLVYFCLKTLAGKVERFEIQGKQAYRVFDAITVIQEKGNVIIEVRTRYSNLSRYHPVCLCAIFTEISRKKTDRHQVSINMKESILSCSVSRIVVF